MNNAELPARIDAVSPEIDGGPREFWAFAAPRYGGPVPTRLRFALDLGRTWARSNEFDGGIHPEQFTVKEGHVPTGLMDPYSD